MRGGEGSGNRFERVLWASRLLVLVPVVAGLVLAVGAAFVATVDAVYSVGTLLRFADPSLSSGARDAPRDSIITAVVKVLDGYLISAILVVFSLGLYELFVSKLDAAEGSETGAMVLHVKSLDDLKNKVVSLVLLVLAIEFFQRALRLPTGVPWTCSTSRAASSSSVRRLLPHRGALPGRQAARRVPRTPSGPLE